MLLRQLQEPIAKRSTNCIYKERYQNSTFQSAEDFNLDRFSTGTTMVGPIADSRCDQMSSTFSVSST